MRAGQALVQLPPGDADRVAQIAEALQGSLPTRSTHVVDALAPRGCFDQQECTNVSVTIPAENICPLYQLDRQATPEEQRAARTDWRCDQQAMVELIRRRFNPPSSATPATLVALTGVDDPQAARTLADGGMVVFDRAFIAGGNAQLTIRHDAPVER